MSNQPYVICPPRFWNSETYWDTEWLSSLVDLIFEPEKSEMAAVVSSVIEQGFITEEQKWELNDIYARSIAIVLPYLP
jgi:hypothetical protein